MTSTEAYKYEAKLSATCILIREPDEVSKIVLEKEANGLEHLVGGDVLNDHNIMQEIRFCSTIGGYSGPYQFSAASLGKTNFSAL